MRFVLCLVLVILVAALHAAPPCGNGNNSPHCTTTTTTTTNTATTTTTTPTTTTTTPTTTTTTPTTTTTTPTTTTTTPTTTTTTPTTTTTTPTPTTTPAPTSVKSINFWNGKQVGTTKIINNATLRGIFAEVIRSRDVTCLQEVRDKYLDSMNLLLNETNTGSANQYSYECSPTLGRNSYYREQYCCFYRTSGFTLLNMTVYDDGDPELTDVYSRDPTTFKYRCHGVNGTWDVCITVLHAAPDDAENEVGNLTNVHDDVITNRHPECDNHILAGDFNADGTYLTPTQLSALHIYYAPQFKWEITDGMDTTVATGNDNTYDRIVTWGEVRNKTVRSGVVYFDQELGLSFDLAWATSDHYGVELEINCDA